MSKSRIEHQHSTNVFEWGNVGLNEDWEKVWKEKIEREWRKKENEKERKWERKRNGPTNEQNNCDW